MTPLGLSFLLSHATKALESTCDALRREEIRAASAARVRTSARKKKFFCIDDDGGGGERAAKRRRRKNQSSGERASFSAMQVFIVVKTCFAPFARPVRNRDGFQSPILCAAAKLSTKTHLHWGLKGPQPRPPRPERPWRNQPNRSPIDVKVDWMAFLSCSRR